MDDNVRFLARLVQERAKQLQGRLPPAEGRGSSLVSATESACRRLFSQAEALANGAPQSPAQDRVDSRTLQRAKQQLDILYEIIATYGDDVGRSDVPVGLLYLVDELIGDLLPSGADPLLHLDNAYMYSTLALFQALSSVFLPSDFALPHPVAFNVPGLDPGNALFAPILAHEVGHTSWRQGVQQSLDSQMDKSAAEVALQAALPSGVDPNQLATMFRSWLQELMCDALAAVLTGPSFLFASCVFLPAPAEGSLSSHPYPADRVAFTLRILERLGWMPVLEELVPGVLGWCRSVSSNPALTGHPAESALRNAIHVVEPTMTSLAEATVTARISSQDFGDGQDELFRHFDLEIPPVSVRGQPASPWLIITAGWLHELHELEGHGANAQTELPFIAADPRLNRFLMKSIELSGVARLWSQYGHPAS